MDRKKGTLSMRKYIHNGKETQYSVIEDGAIYNNDTKRWLKGQVSNSGYRSFYLSFEDGKKRMYAHRLVAETYIPNIENKPEVNHKNGNKDDNRVENLEWVTSSENKQHGISLGLITKRKPVYRFNRKKELVQTYESATKVAEVEGINESWLSEQLRREIKTLSHNSYWSYSSDSSFATKDCGGISKKVGMYTKDKELIAKFESRNDCARKMGYDKKSIGECCNGKKTSYNGYIFEYLDEDIV